MLEKNFSKFTDSVEFSKGNAWAAHFEIYIYINTSISRTQAITKYLLSSWLEDDPASLGKCIDHSFCDLIVTQQGGCGGGGYGKGNSRQGARRGFKGYVRFL